MGINDSAVNLLDVPSIILDISGVDVNWFLVWPLWLLTLILSPLKTHFLSVTLSVFSLSITLPLAFRATVKLHCILPLVSYPTFNILTPAVDPSASIWKQVSRKSTSCPLRRQSRDLLYTQRIVNIVVIVSVQFVKPRCLTSWETACLRVCDDEEVAFF